MALIRVSCREAVLTSRFYRTTGLRFVLMHGTWKMRLFAAAMLLAPRAAQRVILKKLGG